MTVIPQLKRDVLEAEKRVTSASTRRRHWRPPAAALAVVPSLLIVAGVIAVIVLQVRVGAGHPDGGSSQSGRATAITPARSTDQAVIDVLAPTSGADSDSGTAAVQEFTAALRAKVINRCLAAQGLPLAPRSQGQPLAGFDLLPDLTALRARGQFDVLVLGAPPDPTAGMSTSERAAYTRARTRCAAQVPTLTPVNLLLSREGPAAYHRAADRINTEWLNTVTAVIDRSPEVRLANRTAAACSRSTEFPARDYRDAVTVIAGAMGSYYQRHQYAKGNAVNRRGAAVYLRCFGPAVEAVQQVLATRQASFLARNARAMRLIQREVATQVARLERQYGLRFGG